MERLTMWYDGNHAICENEECSYRDCPFADSICKQVQDIIDRLAAYEDTGLEPEEIAKIREDIENGYMKSTARRYGISVDRLRELAEADREGRVRIEQRAHKCPRCGKMTLYPRIDWQYYHCYSCKAQFTQKEVEAALRREQNE